MSLKKNLQLIFIFSFSILFFSSCAQKSVKKNIEKFKTGDIIFHESTLGQGIAVQIATGSKYSHVGMIFKENNEWKVIEAVQPVRIISLADFISHGDGNRFVVKRLKQELDSIQWDLCIAEAKKDLGKDYDAYFEWSDDRIYCSELVYKAYDGALGIELCGKEKIKDMHLEHPLVQEKLKERYGNNIPLEEDVITPACLFNSNLLETVVEE